MIILAYLIIMPHGPRFPQMTGPVIVWILEPTPSGLLDSMINAHRLPHFQKLIEQGTVCRLVQRHAWDFYQGWLESVTGKDSIRIPGAGVIVNPQTYQTRSPDLWTPPRTAMLWQIAQRSGKHVRLIRNREELAGIGDFSAAQLVIIHQSPGDGNDEAYLAEADQTLAAILQKSGPNAALLAVSPLVKTDSAGVFHVNRWLQTNTFLNASETGAIDWGKTQAFFLDASDRGIRINAESNYPQGPVTRDQYEFLRRRLAHELRQITDPDTGEPVFDAVMAGETVFKNRLPYDTPDLVLSPADAYTTLRLDGSLTGDPGNMFSEEALRFLQIYRQPDDSDPVLTGTDGWMVLSGSPFQKSRRLNDIMAADVTPTTLFLLGLPVGQDMQGRVILTALSDEWQAVPQKNVPSHEREDFRVIQPRYP